MIVFKTIFWRGRYWISQGQSYWKLSGGVRAYQMAYWDAQIWATAHMHQIPVIFSEDFGSRTVIEGIRIVNPFDVDFRMEEWLAESVNKEGQD